MKLQETIKKTIPDLLVICGAVLITIGLHLIYPPAAYIGAGIMLLIGGVIGWIHSK